MGDTISASVAISRKPRWYATTPAKSLFAVLVMQGVLFLSAHYRWFWFNERKGYTVLITVAATAVALLLLGATVLVSRFFKSKARFSLATLLLMVPVMAIACAWLAAEIRTAREQSDIVRKIVADGGEVSYYPTNYEPLPTPMEAAITKVFGIDFAFDVFTVRLQSVSGIGEVPKLRKVYKVDLSGAPATDDDLKKIVGLSHLRALWLDRTKITDAGIAHVIEFPELQLLTLGGTAITDTALAHLKSIPNLRLIVLDRTAITDDGLKHLLALEKIERLDVNSTTVTAECLSQFINKYGYEIVIYSDHHLWDFYPKPQSGPKVPKKEEGR